MLNRRTFAQLAGAVALAGVFTAPAMAADMAPDAMVQKISTETLAAIKADRAMLAGDVNRIMSLVDGKLMPHVNFERVTGMAVGPKWRSATPAQKQQLQQEFKKLLVRSYAGAFKMAANKEVKMQPMRGAATGSTAQVNSQLVGGGSSTALNYRLERAPSAAMGWRVYDVAVAGVWQSSRYNNEFKAIVNSKGIDGLIASLTEKNKSNAGK